MNAPEYSGKSNKELRKLTCIKAKTEGRRSTGPGQRGNNSDCIAFLQFGTWAASWDEPAPAKQKGEVAAPFPVDEYTLQLFGPLDVPVEAVTAEAPEAAAPAPTPVKSEAVAVATVDQNEPRLSAPAALPGAFTVTASNRTKKKKQKKGRVEIEGLFVPLTNDEQDSLAYASLTGNASKVYLYLKRTARTAAWYGGGVREREIIFDYTYTEAKGRGFSESTFIRAMKELWAKGFVDVIERGGLRGKARSNSHYKLAADWKTYGKEWKDRTQRQPDPFACTTEPRKAREVKW